MPKELQGFFLYWPAYFIFLAPFIFVSLALVVAGLYFWLR